MAWINRELERRLVWQDWTPTYGAAGSMTYTSVTTNVAKYLIIGKMLFYFIEASGTTGGTGSTYLTFTLPKDATTDATTGANLGTGWGADSSSFATYTAFMSASIAQVYKYDVSNWTLGANRQFSLSGFYEVEL